MNREYRRDGNVYYLFGNPPERTSPRNAVRTVEAALPAPNPEPPAHPLEAYLDFLAGKELISPRERQALERSASPLKARFKGLSTVEAVRKELRPKNATVDALSRKERDLWVNGNPLPWFDIDAALDNFTCDAETAQRFMTFMNEAAREAFLAHAPYYDPELKDATAFFWLIVRMYRLHAEAVPEDAIEVPPAPPAPTPVTRAPSVWRRLLSRITGETEDE